MVKETFEKVCKAMGGEYSSEYGMLEPDVGYETLHEKAAEKQWCSLGHLKNVPDDLTIFKTLGTVELKSKMFQPTGPVRFEQGFFEEKFDKRMMCFKTTTPEFSERLPGVTNVCVIAFPEKKPDSLWIGFPDWGDIPTESLKHMYELNKKIGKK